MAQIKSVTIILKPKAVSDFEFILPNLVTFLSRRKKTIYFLEKESERLQRILKSNFKLVEMIHEDNLHVESDLIITMGGDGTLIGVSRNIKKNSPPIFGVNMGHLGFITEFSKLEFFDELEKALKGDFELKQYNLHQVEIFKKDECTFKSYFLNDVVINNSQISRMLTLSVECNQEHVYNLSGDGLIVSSPIGSTAYSLAAGGPIIHPDVQAITLTPICAHSLTHRPLVIPDNFEILVKALRADDSLKVTLDGQEAITTTANDIIRITKSKSKNVKLIQNPNRSYFRTLKEKFTHGARDIK